MNSDPSTLPLRDIHLPPVVSWWPPAPGWWVLAALLVFVVLVALGFRLHRRRHRTRRAALAALAHIEADYATHRDGHAYARALSELLRRVAILHGGPGAAAATDRRWLELLAGLTGEAIPEAATVVLLVAPYSPRQAARIEPPSYATTGALARRWFDALPARLPRRQGGTRDVHV